MKLHLNRIIETHGLVLSKKAPWMYGDVCLAALATIESSYGIHNIPRYEKAYDRGGIYYNAQLGMKYGAAAACSYSSWQIMYPTAVELGFTGAPTELNNDCVAIYFVMEYIQKRILDKGCERLQDLFDAYNSGTFRDRIIPEEYIAKGMDAYVKLKTEWYKESK